MKQPDFDRRIPQPVVPPFVGLNGTNSPHDANGITPVNQHGYPPLGNNCPERRRDHVVNEDGTPRLGPHGYPIEG